jgi:hypothetical protein
MGQGTTNQFGNFQNPSLGVRSGAVAVSPSKNFNLSNTNTSQTPNRFPNTFGTTQG